MEFSRFRRGVIFRVLFLAAAVFLLFWLLFRTGYVLASLLAGGLILYLVINLIHFAETTNREVARFFQAVQHADFTQSFPVRDMGPTFEQLAESFSRVTRRFLDLRSEKEESFRYLQTVVQHVVIGVISFRPDGEVELINTAAKRLLNISRLKNIQSLEKVSAALTETLFRLKSGEQALLKIRSENSRMYLSLNATMFKLHGEVYTLVSLQNIQNEIERERMARELEIARHVQETLLPKTEPALAGYDIAGICLPAKEVGGDYYDYFGISPERFGFVIGDVAGKGVPAAIYMTLTKGILQSRLNGRLSLAETLAGANRLLYDTMDASTFVSLFFAVLDLPSRELICARAGHNPGLHYSAERQEVQRIQPEGIGLGLERGTIFQKVIQTRSVSLAPGHWFVLFTDGFTEAVNIAGEQFGEERLAELLRNNHELSSRELIGVLRQAVEEFSGEAPRFDDMTLVALKVTH